MENQKSPGKLSQGNQNPGWIQNGYFTNFKMGLKPIQKWQTLKKKKAIPSFLGEFGLIKVVSEFSFGHPKSAISGHIKMGTFVKSGHFWVRVCLVYQTNTADAVHIHRQKLAQLGKNRDVQLFFHLCRGEYSLKLIKLCNLHLSGA